MAYIGKQPAPAALTSSDITDGIISTAKISDDAVDENKLDLTANYAFTGTITGAGGLVKLSSQTMSADSSVSFDGFFSSTYDNYKIIINDVTFSTNDTHLRMRYRQSDADVTTSNYGAVGQTGGIDIGTGNLNQTINNTNNDSFKLTNLSDATSASNVNLQGEITLYNPLNSTEYKMYNHTMVYFGTSATGNFYTLTGGGWFKGNTTALSGFTLLPHQGTFSGSVTLYGVIA